MAFGQERVCLWDIKSKETIFFKNYSYVSSAAINIDNHIAIGIGDGEVYVFDSFRDECLLKIGYVKEFFKRKHDALKLSPAEATLVGNYHKFDFVFSPNGKYLAVIYSNKTFVFDVINGSLVSDLELQKKISKLIFSPNNKFLAIGFGSIKSVELWSIEEKKFLAELTGYSNPVSCMMWEQNQSNSCLFTGDMQSGIKCWDIVELGNKLFPYLKWRASTYTLQTENISLNDVKGLENSKGLLQYFGYKKEGINKISKEILSIVSQDTYKSGNRH